MDDIVTCAMCGSENVYVMWTERCAVKPSLRSDGTMVAEASNQSIEPVDLEDAKLVCWDCGHDKEKPAIEWQ